MSSLTRLLLLVCAAPSVASGLQDYVLVPADSHTTPPHAQVSVLKGLGGYTRLHGHWNGRVARVQNAAQVFRVLPPIGGCTADSGQRSRTSENAKANKCALAVNGSPFHVESGACMGQSVANGVPVCADCVPTPMSFGLRRGASNSTWVLGQLDYATSSELGLSEVIVGQPPGWLVYNGTSAVSTKGGRVAPRTALALWVCH